jgi:hypothetical protein
MERKARLKFCINFFKLSHLVLLAENKCFIHGYLSNDKNDTGKKMILACYQDILNDFLINIDEPTGNLLKAVVDNISLSYSSKISLINIKKVFKDETLMVRNLIILLEEQTPQEQKKIDYIFSGTILDIIVKE